MIDLRRPGSTHHDRLRKRLQDWRADTARHSSALPAAVLSDELLERYWESGGLKSVIETLPKPERESGPMVGGWSYAVGDVVVRDPVVVTASVPRFLVHASAPILFSATDALCADGSGVASITTVEGSTDVHWRDMDGVTVAVQFAILYAGVKWLVAYADADHGIEGMYLAATISGLTDVDAISISLAQQSKDSVQIGIARNVILVAMLSNTMVKFLIVLISGSTTLRKAVLPGFLALIGTGMVWLLGSVLF